MTKSEAAGEKERMVKRIKSREPKLFRHWQWMKETIWTDEPYEARVSRTVL